MHYDNIIAFLDLVDEEYPISNKRRELFCATAFASLISKYRIGQVFMNVIRDTPYYKLLTGTPFDVFYSDSVSDVERAINYLTNPSQFFPRK